MSDNYFYPVYGLDDEQMLCIYRYWKTVTFVPIPTYSILARNLRENDFIYSHSVAKFQDLIGIEE